MSVLRALRDLCDNIGYIGTITKHTESTHRPNPNHSPRREIAQDGIGSDGRKSCTVYLFLRMLCTPARYTGPSSFYIQHKDVCRKIVSIFLDLYAVKIDSRLLTLDFIRTAPSARSLHPEPWPRALPGYVDAVDIRFDAMHTWSRFLALLVLLTTESATLFDQLRSTSHVNALLVALHAAWARTASRTFFVVATTCETGELDASVR